MITWEQFIYFAIAAVLLWAAGAWAAWKDKTITAYTTTIIGLAVFFGYILMMWVSLERPPLRTMGETRLWYSFFLPLTGIIVYSRWKYKWILSFSTVLALVFICVNLFKPEIHSKTLMPALQSPWFAPHVIVYMFAYAVFGVATLMAVFQLLSSSPLTSHHSHLTSHLSPLRQPRLRRPCLHDHRHAVWCPMGQGGVGALLVVGSQGDMGRHHLVCVPCLYSLPPTAKATAPSGPMDTDYLLHPPSNVLVGHQLSALGPRRQRTYL